MWKIWVSAVVWTGRLGRKCVQSVCVTLIHLYSFHITVNFRVISIPFSFHCFESVLQASRLQAMLFQFFWISGWLGPRCCHIQTYPLIQKGTGLGIGCRVNTSQSQHQFHFLEYVDSLWSQVLQREFLPRPLSLLRFDCKGCDCCLVSWSSDHRSPGTFLHRLFNYGSTSHLTPESKSMCRNWQAPIGDWEPDFKLWEQLLDGYFLVK